MLKNDETDEVFIAHCLSSSQRSPRRSNGMSNTTNRKCIVSLTIAFDGHGGVNVDPPVVSIDDYLPACVAARQDGSGQLSLVQSVDPRTGSGMVLPCLGLAQAIQIDLVRRGAQVVLRRRRTRHPGRIGPVRHNTDTTFGQFVSDVELGTVEFGPGVDRHALLADLALSLPEATFAFATSGQARAEKLHDHLRRVGVESTLLKAKRPPHSAPGRVVVGTFAALGHTAVESNKRDVFVVVEATDALHRAAECCLTQADFACRLFGVLSTDKRLSAGERDRLAVVFGFERLMIPAPGMEAISPGIVRWAYAGAGIPRDATPLDVARHLWGDHQRHRLIAKAANLARAGEDVGRSGAGRDAAPASDQVIILVDAVEHAAELGKHLRGWPIHTTDAYVDGLPVHLQQVIQAGRQRWPEGDRWITTTQAAEDIELRTAPGVTAVIWAGAGPGLPPIQEHWLMSPVGSGRRVLLVDVEDRHHPVLRRWTRCRKKAYRATEWLRPCTDAVTHRVEEFLRRREEERNE